MKIKTIREDQKLYKDFKKCQEICSRIWKKQKKVDIKFKPIKGADHFYENYSNEFEKTINEYINQELETK